MCSAKKPLAPDVAGMLALKSDAEKSGRVLMVDFNQRYFLTAIAS